jgi:hypothetical protein
LAQRARCPWLMSHGDGAAAFIRFSVCADRIAAPLSWSAT